MASLEDLAAWMASAPEGAELRWDSPDAGEEQIRVADEAMERLHAGEELVTPPDGAS